MNLRTKFFLPMASITFSLLINPIQATAEELVIYSPQGGDRAIWIAEQAKQAGFDIEILNAGGGELFDRIIAEKNNPQADVVLGLVDVSMSILKKEGIFYAYTPSWTKGLDPIYIDSDSMFHKFWQTPVVIAYRPDVFTEQTAPKSWLDLTKDEYKDHYAIGALKWQTTRVYLSGMLVRFMDEKGQVSDAGWSFMQKLFNNGLVTDDWSKIVKTISTKKRGIDLNWLGGALKMGETGGYTPKIVNTAGGTPFIAEGIGIVAGTEQLEDAKAFVDWFGSPSFMAAYAHQFKQAPVHPEALIRSPKEVTDMVSMLIPQPINWDLVANEIDGWMQRIELELKK